MEAPQLLEADGFDAVSCPRCTHVLEADGFDAVSCPVCRFHTRKAKAKISVSNQTSLIMNFCNILPHACSHQPGCALEGAPARVCAP